MDFININGSNIYFEHIDNQKDTTFLFINSLGTDLRIWNKVVALMLDHANIIRFDKPGHGLSSITSDFEPSLASYAAVVIGLLDNLQISKANIVGLSIGGAIAQYLGIYYPERINKLFLSNTASKLGSLESWEARIKLVKENGISTIADQIMKIWFSESYHQTNPSAVIGYKTMVSNMKQEGYLKACETLKISDLRSEVRRIKIPTFCIAGTTDGSTPPALVKSLADSIANADYFLIEGVGHIPCVEVPVIIAKYLMKD